MPSDYSGIATALLGLIPSAHNIASSTNAAPISVTTASPHGAETGDTVVVHNHLVNTAANGAWQIVKTSATSFLLVGSVGNGVGAATGLARSAAFGTRYNIPSGTDRPNAASVNVALEALGDRTAALLYLLQYAQVVHGGGTTTYNDAASILMKAGSGIVGEDGAIILGKFELAQGSLLELLASSEILADASSLIRLKNDSTTQFDAGAIFTVATLLDILSGGSVVVRGGGLVDIKGDGVTTGAGDLIVRGGAKLDVEDNAVLQVDALATVDLNGTIDASGGGLIFNGSTTYVGTLNDATDKTLTNPTRFSGDGGWVKRRSPHTFGDGNATITPQKSDYLELKVTGGAGHLTADATWTLNDPPESDIELSAFAASADLDIKTLFIKDSGGGTIVTLVGTDSGARKWARLLYRGGSSWSVISSYKDHS